MEKVAICSMYDLAKLERTSKKFNFKISNNNPDFVLCYGGDGTILFAEREWPSIPKLLIKRTKICRRCDYEYHDLNKVLKEIIKGNFRIVKEMKLEL